MNQIPYRTEYDQQQAEYHSGPHTQPRSWISTPADWCPKPWARQSSDGDTWYRGSTKYIHSSIPLVQQ